MARKIIEVSIKSYLYKYLKHSRGMDATYLVPGLYNFKGRATSRQAHLNFFSSTEQPTHSFGFSMYYPSLRKAYIIAKDLEEDFWADMFGMTQGFVCAGLSAKEGIEHFLERLHIGEEELKFETAYKRWTRRPQRFRQKVDWKPIKMR